MGNRVLELVWLPAAGPARRTSGALLCLCASPWVRVRARAPAPRRAAPQSLPVGAQVTAVPRSQFLASGGRGFPACGLGRRSLEGGGAGAAEPGPTGFSTRHTEAPEGRFGLREGVRLKGACAVGPEPALRAQRPPEAERRNPGKGARRRGSPWPGASGARGGSASPRGVSLASGGLRALVDPDAKAGLRGALPGRPKRTSGRV